MDMGKFWSLFLVLAFLCALLNPYVGLFSVFLLVILLVYFSLAVNIKGIIARRMFSLAEADIDNHSAVLQRSGTALVNAWRVIALLLFLLVTLVSGGVWLLASGYGNSQIASSDMTPLSIFSPDFKLAASIILLIASVGFNLLATVSIFIKCKQFSAELKSVVAVSRPENLKAVGGISFKVNLPVVGAVWIMAMAFGLLNSHFGWLSILLHLFYSLFIVILTFTLHIYAKLAVKQSVAGMKARYMLTNMAGGQSLNRLLQVIVWTIAGLLIVVQVLCSFTVPTGVFTVLDTGLDILMLLLSCVANVVLALILCTYVRDMK